MLNNLILVTGASGGIGKAVIQKLLQNNFSIAAITSKISKIEDAYKNQERVLCIERDLNDIDGIPALIKNIVKQHGQVRGLVHCAGFDKMSPLYLAKPFDLLSLFNIHVMSATSLCSQFAKKDIAAKGCSIVLISSLAAHEGAAGKTSYACVKGALEGFLPSAAAELAEKGIRINIVAPGVTKTDMAQAYMNKLTDEQLQFLNASYPLGLGNPEDVAHAIHFLLSDEARWITGQTLLLDGGHMCRKV